MKMSGKKAQMSIFDAANNRIVVAYACFKIIPYKIKEGMSAMCVSEPIELRGWR